MTQTTVQITIEELYHPNGEVSADADVSVTFDMVPEEKQTRDYPGYPATAELVAWIVDSYSLYNDDTGEMIEEGLMATTPRWLRKAIDSHITEFEDDLIEMACEKEAEKAEDWRY